MGLVTPDFGLVFWMLVSFLILLFILKKFAWKPILGSLKAREDSIDEALKSAEMAKDQMAKLQADNLKILQEAKEEREKLLKEAREVKDRIIADAKSEAVLEADKIIIAAKSQIESEKLSAIKEIREKVVLLSVDNAEKIIHKNLDSDSKQRDFADSLLNKMELN
jgi:F-type H+-transporting ATPase subunit b